MKRGAQRGAGLLVIALAVSVAQADLEVDWSFDLATAGADVSWTSPTYLEPDADRFDVSWEITLVEATVRYLFFVLTVDVTDQVPPEVRMGSVSAPGPAPLVVYDDTIVYPLPPEPPGISADVQLGLDADGYGYVTVSDVMLGEVTVYLEGFGYVTVDVEEVRLAGTVHGEAVYSPVGDMNCDGTVDLRDINPFTLALSSPAAYALAFPECDLMKGDINGDGVFDFRDINPFVALLTTMR